MKEADRVFSIHIRKKYADKDGMVKCYTCPLVRHYRSRGMTCGHFVSRKAKNTRYDERNCRPQCFYCNSQRFGNGRPVEFSAGLVQEYGEGIVEELFAQGRVLVPNFNYQQVIDMYTIAPKKTGI